MLSSYGSTWLRLSEIETGQALPGICAAERVLESKGEETLGISVQTTSIFSGNFIYIYMSALSHNKIGGTSIGPVALRILSSSISTCLLLTRIANTIKHI